MEKCTGKKSPDDKTGEEGAVITHREMTDLPWNMEVTKWGWVYDKGHVMGLWCRCKAAVLERPVWCRCCTSTHTHNWYPVSRNATTAPVHSLHITWQCTCSSLYCSGN